jgi:NAD(P)-dependent dehydrogenase (short-subunit alcohol dehydrogenase family)
MYTYAQARRFEGEGLTFNAVSPGAVKTSLGSKAGGPFIDRIRTALDAICVGSPFARELLSETEVALLSPDLEIGPWGAIALIDDGWSGVDRGRRPGEEVVAREPIR